MGVRPFKDDTVLVPDYMYMIGDSCYEMPVMDDPWEFLMSIANVSTIEHSDDKDDEWVSVSSPTALWRVAVCCDTDDMSPAWPRGFALSIINKDVSSLMAMDPVVVKDWESHTGIPWWGLAFFDQSLINDEWLSTIHHGVYTTPDRVRLLGSMMGDSWLDDMPSWVIRDINTIEHVNGVFGERDSELSVMESRGRWNADDMLPVPVDGESRWFIALFNLDMSSCRHHQFDTIDSFRSRPHNAFLLSRDIINSHHDGMMGVWRRIRDGGRTCYSYPLSYIMMSLGIAQNDDYHLNCVDARCIHDDIIPFMLSHPDVVSWGSAAWLKSGVIKSFHFSDYRSAYYGIDVMNTYDGESSLLRDGMRRIQDSTAIRDEAVRICAGNPRLAGFVIMTLGMSPCDDEIIADVLHSVNGMGESIYDRFNVYRNTANGLIIWDNHMMSSFHQWCVHEYEYPYEFVRECDIRECA